MQFTDVTGTVKSVDIPAWHLEEALEAGVWIHRRAAQARPRPLYCSGAHGQLLQAPGTRLRSTGLCWLGADQPPNNLNVYHLTAGERAERNIAELPGSLAEAMRELKADAVLKGALCEMTYEAFNRAKWAEIEESRTHVIDWEVERYLELA